MNNIHFKGNTFVIHESELDPGLLDMLVICGGSGEQSDNVDAVMDAYQITGEFIDCANYLRQYGAWDDNELNDHAENLKRLTWLAGCDLNENGEIHFTTY